MVKKSFYALLALLVFTSAPLARAEEPAAECPAFELKVEPDGDSKAIFTVTPALAELDYNWTVSAGTILFGQGTESISVFHDTPEPVIIRVDIQDLDPRCPPEAAIISATIQMN